MRIILKDIVNIMEKHFPLHLAESWDNPGLQIGSLSAPVKSVAVALDADEYSIDQALSLKADVLITHHPLFFKGVKKIDYAQHEGRIIQKLARSGTAVYSAHTNLDSAPNGLSQYLAELIGLKDIKLLGYQREETLYKLVVFVPQTHLEAVRTAVYEAGAGHIGNYSDCGFYTRGTGTFRPLEGAEPYTGNVGQLEYADEFRLETIVRKNQAPQVLSAVLEAHPYEEVAYDLLPLAAGGLKYSYGRAGELQKPVTLEQFACIVKKKLGISGIKVAGDPGKMIKKVGLAGGAGSALINTASQQGVDVFISGDIKYHEAQAGLEKGLAIIDAGHQGTEAAVRPFLQQLLRDELSIFKSPCSVDVLDSKPIFIFY
ncbi:MAG: Nif3-like dinuclear metal center hexameric protein [Syntrophomonadaceae bacterium]|jgi:dinuclear metal center YbgI/SA1388 family protein|nr:Nif3-like dinuclear metal center hexameric protein [Syntrophomonadaceae bacterium]